jgi:hypothetical protein
MYLSGNAVEGELLEIAADGHVRHAEQFGQVSDADSSGAPELTEDPDLTLLSEHRCVLPMLESDPVPTESNMI